MMSRRSAVLGLCTAFAPLTPEAAVADSTVVDSVGMTLADPLPTDSIIEGTVMEKNRQRRRQRAVELAVASCSFCALTLSGLVDQPATAPRDDGQRSSPYL